MAISQLVDPHRASQILPASHFQFQFYKELFFYVHTPTVNLCLGKVTHTKNQPISDMMPKMFQNSPLYISLNTKNGLPGIVYGFISFLS